MFSKLTKILTLLFFAPIYWVFIMIDRYIFDVKKGIIPNPFLKDVIPRSLPEIFEYGAPPKGKWLFETVVANYLDKKDPGMNRKYLAYRVLGGSEFEPDKSVIRIELDYLESKLGGTQEIPRTFNVFVKLSTCRPVSCLFKAMISALSYPTVKEVGFNNTVFPFLNSVARDHSAAFADEFSENFVIPRNILAKWSRTFDRSIIITECVDMATYHSNPDWIDLRPDAVELMLRELAYMHAMTLTLHDRTGEVARFPSKKAERFIQANFRNEQRSAEWLDAIVSLYIGDQPASCRTVWAQILRRLMREPTAISHGDYRPGNMLFNADFSKQIITDWEVNSICPIMWDVTYCILLGSSIENRRRDQRTYVDNYLKKVKKIYKMLYCPSVSDDDGAEIIPGFPTLDQCMDVYKICLLMVDFFGWSIWRFGGVGKTQGNTSNDGKAWGAKVLAGMIDALTDQRDLARILDFDDQEEGLKIVTQFIADLSAKKGLNVPSSPRE